MADPLPEEKPLDPEAARFLGRVRRLVASSLLFTGLALALVLGAIGYRVWRAAESATAIEGEIALPRGAKLLGTSVGEGLLALTIELEGATEIRFFDRATLKPRGRVRVSSER